MVQIMCLKVHETQRAEDGGVFWTYDLCLTTYEVLGQLDC